LLAHQHATTWQLGRLLLGFSKVALNPAFQLEIQIGHPALLSYSPLRSESLTPDSLLGVALKQPSAIGISLAANTAPWIRSDRYPR
jgi:hypothetical protein